MKKTFYALIFLSALFFAEGAFGATCNDQANGSWDETATWDCGVVPGLGDDVTIDSHTITISANQAAKALTISGGNLNMGLYTFSVYGDWTYTSGNLYSETSELIFASTTAAQTFTPGNVNYNKITVNKGNWDLTISGTAKVKDDFKISSSGSSAELIGGTIELKGNLIMESAVAYGRSTIFKLVGDQDQTITSNGGKFSSLYFEKTEGKVIVENDIILQENWTWVSGDIEFKTSTIKFVTNGGVASDSSFYPGEVEYYKIESLKGSYDLNLTGNIKVTEEFRITSGIDLFLDDNIITVKNFIQTGGVFTMQTGAMKITGDFTRTGGTFNPGTSVVSFLGENQTIDVTGVDTSFYKIYKMVNQVDTFTITAGNNLTIASGGMIRFWGKPEGKTLSVVSSSPGIPYNITRTGVARIEYTNWSDSNWSTATVAAASSLGTGNTNLSVTKEFISTIRATGGDYSSLSTWEAGVQTNLTASTTKVFSHGGITGAIADIDTVTGAISGATADVVHASATQILLENIVGIFQSGEQVQVDVSNYVTISDDGFGAINVAHPYNDWPTGLNNGLTVDGSTTGVDNYVKVYVPRSERHNGKIKDKSGNYTGFIALSYIRHYDDYGVVEGVLFDFKDLDNNIILGSYTAGGAHIRFNNNIVLNPRFRSISSGDYKNIFMYNNIFIINSGRASSYQILDAGTTNVGNPRYAFNNTFYSTSTFPFADKVYYVYNNVVWTSSSVPITNYTEVDYNIFKNSFSAGSSDISNVSLNGLDFISTDLGSEDFHIKSDSVAVEAGTDLSTHSIFPIVDDIDGQDRPVWEAWDIGVDQAARKIYRSVGPGKTGTLTVGTSNDLNISSETAIFASALPDNVGVGDAIQYDSDNNGTVDSIAFITERHSSTSYKIQNAEGGIPVQTVATDNDWSIFRAYTSLVNAESGTENTGLDDAVEQFDADWSGSGGRDLTADDLQWNIACYKDAVDSTAITINGWTTSDRNFIKIYTPVDASEVGRSQRHRGILGTGFQLKNTTSNNFVLYNKEVWIEGLEIDGTTSTGAPIYIAEAGTSNIKISDNVIHGNSSGCYELGGNGYLHNFWNNICFSDGNGISNLSTDEAYIYSNTFFNTGSAPNATTAIYGGANTVAKNNIALGYGGSSSFYCYTGTFNAGSNYNISSDTSAPGANSLQSADVVFIDENGYDFHLDRNDGTARMAGVNLSDDNYLSFSNDIDGQERLVIWDIGADGIFLPKFEIRGNEQFRGDIEMR